MNNYPYAYQQRGKMSGINSHKSESISCFTTALPEDPVVAMAYVPYQTDSTTYDEIKALQKGTLFPVLYKPFLGSGNR